MQRERWKIQPCHEVNTHSQESVRASEWRSGRCCVSQHNTRPRRQSNVHMTSRMATKCLLHAPAFPPDKWQRHLLWDYSNPGPISHCENQDVGKPSVVETTWKCAYFHTVSGRRHAGIWNILFNCMELDHNSGHGNRSRFLCVPLTAHSSL